MLVDRPAAAGECGDGTPDYTARRVLTIGDVTNVSKVYISGWNMREEETGPIGRHRVVIRLPQQGVNYVFDPSRNDGAEIKFPTPPGASKSGSRQTVERRPDGTTVRHIQLMLADGEWTDITTTICRADGVMLQQVFIFPDPHGKLLNGRLTQSDIDVGPLSKSLFEVPASVVIKRP